MAVEDGANGGGTVGTAAVGCSAGKGAEGAVGEVAGVLWAEADDEAVDGDAHPGGTGADAVEQQAAVEPVSGDGVEGVGEMGGGVVAPGLVLDVETTPVAREAVALVALTVAAVPIAAEVVVCDADEAREVGGAIADVVGVGLRGEGALGGAQHGQREAAEGADEVRALATDLVGGVDVLEQQTPAAVVGARAFAWLFGGADEGVGVETAARDVGAASSTPTASSPPTTTPNASYAPSFCGASARSAVTPSVTTDSPSG